MTSPAQELHRAARRESPEATRTGSSGPDYAIDLTETEMQPSLHAAEQKKVSLSAPLFAHYFGVTDDSVDRG